MCRKVSFGSVKHFSSIENRFWVFSFSQVKIIVSELFYVFYVAILIMGFLILWHFVKHSDG